MISNKDNYINIGTGVFISKETLTWANAGKAI